MSKLTQNQRKVMSEEQAYVKAYIKLLTQASEKATVK